VVVQDVRPDVDQVRRERADGDGVVGLVDDEDVEAGSSLRTALPGDSDTTETSNRLWSIRLTRPKRCSCAPPFVPVAKTSTMRMRSAATDAGRRTVSRHGSWRRCP
jgi:hypothetical protein